MSNSKTTCFTLAGRIAALGTGRGQRRSLRGYCKGAQSCDRQLLSWLKLNRCWLDVAAHLRKRASGRRISRCGFHGGYHPAKTRLARRWHPMGWWPVLPRGYYGTDGVLWRQAAGAALGAASAYASCYQTQSVWNGYTYVQQTVRGKLNRRARWRPLCAWETLRCPASGP